MKIKDLTSSLLGNKNPNSNDDLGFGTKIISSGERLINRDGSFNIVRTGLRTYTLYQWLVEMSWGWFFSIVFLFYGIANALFAIGFLIIGAENLMGKSSGSILEDFTQAFFFSIQTFTTVGYGALNPQGIAANLLASFDALTGLLSFALITGLFFARFSKPRAQLLFSRYAIIAPYRGGLSFQFRIANRRNNKIIDLTAQVSMTWVEDHQGEKVRRFAPMELERTQVSLFPLNWTIVHPIDEQSPLLNKTPAELEAISAEFTILNEGFDETFVQRILHLERDEVECPLRSHVPSQTGNDRSGTGQDRSRPGGVKGYKKAGITFFHRLLNLRPSRGSNQ